MSGEERRYTLAEAASELRRQECQQFGHDWEIISALDGIPVRICCGRCGVSYRVGRFDLRDDLVEGAS